MTGNDIAVVITAVGFLITSCTSAGALIVSLRNGERAKRIGAAVKEIAVQTDGINAQLVKVTGEAKFAEGLKQGEDNPRNGNEPVKVEIVKIPPLPGA